MTICVTQYSMWKPFGTLCEKTKKKYFALLKHKAELGSKEFFGASPLSCSVFDGYCFMCT